ncbi:MAG TPA: alpha-isopropylmalate synthase regulatory domain-containing protein, partial [bacterium]|nr:alpha-isopropylmalate synthase regulatory domain-containing protein [bacterium]
LADKKKDIYDDDLVALMETESDRTPAFTMAYLHTSSGTETISTATVVLKRPDGTTVQDASCGDGPVDAIYRVIDRVTGVTPKLVGYSLAAVTEGADAQGEVHIRIESDGMTVRGKGASTDVVEASARAYLDAVNRLLAWRDKKEK